MPSVSGLYELADKTVEQLSLKLSVCRELLVHRSPRSFRIIFSAALRFAKC